MSTCLLICLSYFSRGVQSNKNLGHLFSKKNFFFNVHSISYYFHLCSLHLKIDASYFGILFDVRCFTCNILNTFPLKPVKMLSQLAAFLHKYTSKYIHIHIHDTLSGYTLALMMQDTPHGYTFTFMMQDTLSGMFSWLNMDKFLKIFSVQMSILKKKKKIASFVSPRYDCILENSLFFLL